MSASSALRLFPVVLCSQCIVWPQTSTTGDTSETDNSLTTTADTAAEPSPYCAPEQTPFPHCGCLTFATSIGSYFNDIGYALAPTPTGGVALAGEFTTTVTFGAGQAGETTLDGGSGPRSEGFVALFSVNGELLWVRQQSSFETSDTTRVAVDEATGRIAAGGQYQSPLTVSGGCVQHVLPEDHTEGYITSYDDQGTLQWAVYTQSDDTEVITALSFGAAGELYVTGYSEAAHVDVFSTNGSRLRLKDMGPGGYTGETSAFLLRIEADGTLTWAQRLMGAGFQEVDRLAVLSDGNLVVAGHFTTELVLDPGGPGEVTLTPSASLFFARYSPDGALLSSQTAAGQGSTYAGGLVATSTGFVFAGQTSASTVWAPGLPQETTTPARSISFASFLNDDTFQSVYSLSDASNPGALASNEEDTSFAVAGWQGATTTYGLGEPNEVTVDADPDNTNAWDPVLLVLDDNGLLDCFWHLDGNETFDQAHGVAYDDSGGIWVTGQFHDTLVLAQGRPDERTLHSVDDNDLFLARFTLRPPPRDTADTATPDTAADEGTNTTLP